MREIKRNSASEIEDRGGNRVGERLEEIWGELNQRQTAREILREKSSVIRTKGKGSTASDGEIKRKRQDWRNIGIEIDR